MAEDIGLEPNFDFDLEKPDKKSKKKKKERSAPAEAVENNEEKEEKPSEPVDPSTMSKTAKRKLKRKIKLERRLEEEANPELAAERKRIKLEEEQKEKDAKPKYKGKDKSLSFEAIETKFQVLLGSLSETTSRFKEGEDIIKKQVEEGKISAAEANTLYRVYNRNLRIKRFRNRLISQIGEDADLEVVKNWVGVWVKAGKMTKADAGTLVRRYRVRENRRLTRINEKSNNSACFHCREPGHILANCPKKNDSQASEGICFKCGSTEHSIQACKKKNVRGFPFATCFVCKQTGHISRDCHQNQNGVFPDGGGCRVCGATSHLKKDCPQLAEQKASINGRERKQFVGRASGHSMESADVDYDPTWQKNNDNENTQKPVKKVAKHIKF